MLLSLFPLLLLSEPIPEEDKDVELQDVVSESSSSSTTPSSVDAAPSSTAASDDITVGRESEMSVFAIDIHARSHQDRNANARKFIAILMTLQ